MDSIDVAAPVVHGARTPEQHIAALVRAYRASRLAAYQGTAGVRPADAEKLADRDAALKQERMLAHLARARAAGAGTTQP